MDSRGLAGDNVFSRNIMRYVINTTFPCLPVAAERCPMFECLQLSDAFVWSW